MTASRLPWDTHSDNQLQADSHEATFGALSDLVDQLVARPGRTAAAG